MYKIKFAFRPGGIMMVWHDTRASIETALLDRARPSKDGLL